MNFDLSTYKFSNYNHKVFLDGKIYLFNALTGGFGEVNENNRKVVEECNFRGDDIPQNITVDDKLLNSLILGGFLIYKDIDELNMLTSVNNIARFSGENSLGLTLIPTMKCNFRCTYCFEKCEGYPDEDMSPEIMQKVIELINNRVKNEGNLSIAWFGGEPLVKFDIVKELQSKINYLAKEKNINVHSSIITNGYLLNKKVSDELVDLGVKFAQVTIDGSKEIHDQRRVLTNGQGTYEKIIKNLLESNEELQISIRVNIDKKNIGCIDDFLDSLKKSGIVNKKNIRLYFSVVRDYDTAKGCIAENCYNIKEYSQEEMKLNELALRKGIKTRTPINPQISSCGAVSTKALLVEPDGSLQKCWSLVGNKDTRIGHLDTNQLDEQKNLFTSNEIKWYSWSGYKKDECKKCSILPLCMGGCPYYDIYNNRAYSDSEYSCAALKYNLKDTLKLIAHEHLNG